MRILGYEVSDKEIEKEVYSDILELDSEGKRVICQRDIDELQLILSFTEKQPEENRENIKALLFKLNNITLRMRQEQNHARPHFHIEYKNQYSASYAIDTFEKLAGRSPPNTKSQFWNGLYDTKALYCLHGIKCRQEKMFKV